MGDLETSYLKSRRGGVSKKFGREEVHSVTIKIVDNKYINKNKGLGDDRTGSISFVRTKNNKKSFTLRVTSCIMTYTLKNFTTISP